MAEKKEKQSKGDEIFEDLKLMFKGEKKLGLHFEAAGELKKAPKASDPHEAAAELAKMFYSSIKGQDISMYKTTNEILGHLMTQIGEKAYGQFISMLNRKKPEAAEAYKLLIEAHKEHYATNVLRTTQSRLEQLPYDEKIAMAKKIKGKHESLKGLEEKVLAQHLPNLAKKESEFELEANAMEGAGSLNAEKYAEAIKGEYEKYAAEKKKYKKEEPIRREEAA